jgi:hypothetical protein
LGNSKENKRNWNRVENISLLVCPIDVNLFHENSNAIKKIGMACYF